MSKIVLYDNREEENKRKFYNTLKALPPDEYVVEIKKNRPIHTIKQSSYFHVLCQIYAIHTGHYLDEIKDEFKRDRFFEMKIDNQGREFKRLKSTSKLSDVDYQIVITLFLEWGKEKHPEVIVPQKRDMDYKMWMEIGNAYNRTFSGY